MSAPLVTPADLDTPPSPSARPVAPGLFTWPSDDPRLLGSQCGACGLMVFPSTPRCPRCATPSTEGVPFARRGTLWTFTTQGFAPKSPPYAFPVADATFEPYLVGYVEFPGEARIEGRIVGCRYADLRFDMEMETAVVPFGVDADGTQVVTYAFRPAG